MPLPLPPTSSLLPPLLFSHPPGKMVGFGKIAKRVFSQSAPFPCFPAFLSIPCMVPPLTPCFFVFSHSALLCALEKRNHRSSEVKKKREGGGRREGNERWSKVERLDSGGKKTTRSACLMQEINSSVVL